MSIFTKYFERLFLKKKKEEIEKIEELKTDKEKVMGWSHSKSIYYYLITSPTIHSVSTETNELSDSSDSSCDEDEFYDFEEDDESNTFDELE